MVVDTDVFSLLYVHQNSADPRVPVWRRQLAGSRVLISFQTRAELLSGALANKWGTRRIAHLRKILDQTPTIRADDEVIDAHATLVVQCRRAGHALWDKRSFGHSLLRALAKTSSWVRRTSDWVAARSASSRRDSMPLVSSA